MAHLLEAECDHIEKGPFGDKDGRLGEGSSVRNLESLFEFIIIA